MPSARPSKTLRHLGISRMLRQPIRAYRALSRSTGIGANPYRDSIRIANEKQGIGVRYIASPSRAEAEKLRAKAIHESDLGATAIDERMPLSAKYLGLAGTIPFFASAGTAIWAGDPVVAATACHGCVVYGCSILSFLGAVHWGVALRSPTGSLTRPWDFAYSVCPSIAAAGAGLMPDENALVTLLPAFVAALIYDSARFAAHGNHQVPKWYAKLRKPLTFAAITSLGICTGVTWELKKGPTAVEAAKDSNHQKGEEKVSTQLIEDVSVNSVGEANQEG